jgi:hypothetical protein
MKSHQHGMDIHHSSEATLQGPSGRDRNIDQRDHKRRVRDNVGQAKADDGIQQIKAILGKLDHPLGRNRKVSHTHALVRTKTSAVNKPKPKPKTHRDQRPGSTSSSSIPGEVDFTHNNYRVASTSSGSHVSRGFSLESIQSVASTHAATRTVSHGSGSGSESDERGSDAEGSEQKDLKKKDLSKKNLRKKNLRKRNPKKTNSMEKDLMKKNRNWHRTHSYQNHQRSQNPKSVSHPVSSLGHTTVPTHAGDMWNLRVWTVTNTPMGRTRSVWIKNHSGTLVSMTMVTVILSMVSMVSIMME